MYDYYFKKKLFTNLHIFLISNYYTKKHKISFSKYHNDDFYIFTIT